MNEKVETKKPTKATGSRVIKAKDLSVSIADKELCSEKAFGVCVRSLLQNNRQGTVSVKGRSDVNRSTKKPWRQKGTGRARAGSARSPLWRGGGVIHGPQQRVRTLKVGKNIRKGVLRSLFWNYLERGKIMTVNADGFGDVPKTAKALGLLKGENLHEKKIKLFLRHDDALMQSSFANLKNVQTLFFDQPNAYDLAAGDVWVVLGKDMDDFKGMVKRWL